MNLGSFYWILVAPIGAFPGDGTAQWQPARYTGRAGNSIGETWDFIGLLSADGHHHVDVLNVGEEICRDDTVRQELESDISFRYRLLEVVNTMHALDANALLTAIGAGLDEIGSHYDFKRTMSSPAPATAGDIQPGSCPPASAAMGLSGAGEAICDDCPPVGYPTDETRCLPCPRRVTSS